MIALLFYCSVLIFLICLFKLWSSANIQKSKRKKYINGMVLSTLVSLFIMSSDLVTFLFIVGFLVFGSCIIFILVTGLKNKARAKKYYLGILMSISLLFANSFLASHGINFRINPTDKAPTVASEKISDTNLNSNSTITSKATNTAVKESVENNKNATNANSTPVDNSTNQVSTSNNSNSSTSSTSSSTSKNISSNSSGFNSIKHEDVTTAPTAEQQKSDRTVYYTPGGKSFHYNRNCATLKRSKTVLSGKLSDVIRLGKSDPCNVCVRQ